LYRVCPEAAALAVLDLAAVLVEDAAEAGEQDGDSKQNGSVREMKKGAVVLIVIAVLIVILAASVIGRYNQLVELEETVDARWAQVENQLQRRADLIPNLVNTVRGYASHEEQIFADVADARSRLLGATTPEAQMQANSGLDSALGRLLAISEAYPELKADTSFIRLQDELAGTENRIATERMRFNESVQSWNTTIRRFPMNILASLFGRETKAFFEVAPGAQQVPQVEF
jgi:LemA protein